MPIKLRRHISEKAYTIALDLIDFFSEEGVRGPDFSWTTFFDEDIHTIVLSQIINSISDRHYKLYKNYIENAATLASAEISRKYKKLFANLGIIK